MSFALRDFESVVRHIYSVSTIYTSNYRAGIFSFHTVYTYVNRRRRDVFILFFFLKYLQTRKNFGEKVVFKIVPLARKRLETFGRSKISRVEAFGNSGTRQLQSIYDFLIIQSVIQSGKD